MKAQLLGALLVTLAITSCSLGFLETEAQTGVLQSKFEAGRVAIVFGFSSDVVSVLQIRRLLEHQGLLYDVVADANVSLLEKRLFSAIVVIGVFQPDDGLVAFLEGAVRNGAGSIWVGGELPASLSALFGVAPEDLLAVDFQDVRAIDYGDVATGVFGETLYPVALAGGFAQGYFVDDSGRRVAVAEVSFKQAGFGLTYYFGYDVASWWYSDVNAPWLRAYRLYLALEDVLSERLVVRLAAYPRNLKSAFIARIEDVDPLHNSVDWLSRAGDYLDYYSARGASLTVSLIPVYVDPSIDLTAKLGDASAGPLRAWLSEVLLKGGTIVQHGYTHQLGDQKTGVAAELFDSEKQSWLSYEEQLDRIGKGIDQIFSSMGFSLQGFEAPHYLANGDTYAALRALGFTFVTQNSNTPFFDRYEAVEGLVNIPETLGYVPLEFPAGLEEQMMFNMDVLYNMSAPMLFFNHLFEDASSRVGERLLDHAVEKRGVWLTNAASLAGFWHERLSAYTSMNVDLGSDGKVRIVLGQCDRAGLTLVFNQEVQIQSISVNGAGWPVFNENYVILPVLPFSTNSVVIDLEGAERNVNLPVGLFSLVSSVVFSSFFVLKVRRGKFLLKSGGVLVDG